MSSKKYNSLLNFIQGILFLRSKNTNQYEDSKLRFGALENA